MAVSSQGHSSCGGSLPGERLADARLQLVVAQRHSPLLRRERANTHVGTGLCAGHRRERRVELPRCESLLLELALAVLPAALAVGGALGHRRADQVEQQHKADDEANDYHERDQSTVHVRDGLPPAHVAERVHRVAVAVVLAVVHDPEHDGRQHGQRHRIKEPQREPSRVGVAVLVRVPEGAVSQRQRVLEGQESPPAELPQAEEQPHRADDESERHADRQKYHRERTAPEYATTELALVPGWRIEERIHEALEPLRRLLREHVPGDVDWLVADGALDERDVSPSEGRGSVLVEQLPGLADRLGVVGVVQVDHRCPQLVLSRTGEGDVGHLPLERNDVAVRLVPGLLGVVACVVLGPLGANGDH